MVCKDKQRLKHAMKKIDIFLKENLSLYIHPGKIYFQHIKMGVKFLGVFIKPYRIYIDKRCKTAFHRAMCRKHDNLQDFVSTTNSYLGLMSGYDSYRLRKKILFCNTNAVYSYTVGSSLNKINTKKGKNEI